MGLFNQPLFFYLLFMPSKVARVELPRGPIPALIAVI